MRVRARVCPNNVRLHVSLKSAASVSYKHADVFENVIVKKR